LSQLFYIYRDRLRPFLNLDELPAEGLMGNHVHLLAIPARQTGLARWAGLRRQQTGHVWQNRFYLADPRSS